MMLSPVSPPSSLSAAERPGAMLKIEPPGGTIKPFLSILRSSRCSWRSSQLLDQDSTGVVRAPDATDQRGRPARLFLGCVKPDVVKLVQSRANWVSCRVLHCCSVDPGLLKVRLPPGSDGM